MENNFAKNFKRLRIENGMTQEEIGIKLHTDYSTIGKWEKGSRSPIMEDVIKISELFDISLQELICGNLDNKKSNDFITFQSVLKEKGILNKQENITEEDYNKIIDFVDKNIDILINKNEKRR